MAAKSATLSGGGCLYLGVGEAPGTTTRVFQWRPLNEGREFCWQSCSSWWYYYDGLKGQVCKNLHRNSSQETSNSLWLSSTATNNLSIMKDYTLYILAMANIAPRMQTAPWISTWRYTLMLWGIDNYYWKEIGDGRSSRGCKPIWPLDACSIISSMKTQ